MSAAEQADPAARWADGYCGAVTHLVRALAALPTVDPSTPQQASKTSSALLGSLVGGLDETIDGLQRLDAPPAPAADKARRDMVERFGDIRQRTQNVRQRIDDAHADPAVTRDALGDARATLDQIAGLNVLKGLQDVPDTDAASKRTPGCQQLTVPAAPK
ncbi:hypothetical protein [Amycolatopsis sp. NPDC059021]|uniref:hypothetical protein n=1 Tax=Amycolatopsis sp. NPDC059021 TaxID=3346704 RepID=UPI0036733834